LVLPGIRTAADNQGVGERGDFAQIQNANILRLLRFGGVNGSEPEGIRFWRYSLLE